MTIVGVSLGDLERQDFYRKALSAQFPDQDLQVVGVAEFGRISSDATDSRDVVVMSGLADNLVDKDHRLNFQNANVMSVLNAMITFVLTFREESLTRHYLNCFSMQALSVALVACDLAKKKGVDLLDLQQRELFLRHLDSENLLPIVNLDQAQVGFTNDVQFTDAGSKFLNPEVSHWVALHMQGILLERMQALLDEGSDLELLATRELMVGGINKTIVYGLRWKGHIIALQPHLDYTVEHVRVIVRRAIEEGHFPDVILDMAEPPKVYGLAHFGL